MPQVKFPSLAEVPEGLRASAKPVEEGSDEVVVNVVVATAVDEFRDNNIRLSKERDDLSAEVAALKEIVGDDPEAFKTSYAELRQTKQRVDDGELKETRGVEEAVAKRVEEMRKGYEDRLSTEAREKAAYRQQAEAAQQNLRNSFVRSAIKDACIAEGSGVEPSAIDDITTVGLRIFQADDTGKLTAKDGEATIYGADGVNPMNPKEWLVKLKDEKPFFFKSTNGGGAGGDTTTGTHKGKTEALKGMTAAERLDWANANPQKKTGAQA